MQVTSDSAVLSRLLGLEMQLADTARRVRSLTQTIDDVLYGVIDHPKAPRELLVILAVSLADELEVIETRFQPSVRELVKYMQHGLDYHHR